MVFIEHNLDHSQNYTVSGSTTFDVYDWDHTPNCTVYIEGECNTICRQTESTNVSNMCNVWSQDKSKFFYDISDNLHSLQHCEEYCRDAPACLGFVDVWEARPYCTMKTSVSKTAIATNAAVAEDFWQMT